MAPSEWTVALVALACWALLAALHARGSGLPDGHGPDAAHTAADHLAMHHAATQPAAEHTGSWLAAQGNWLLMAPAMMLPSALPAARHVALNSRWRRRQRGSAGSWPPTSPSGCCSVPSWSDRRLGAPADRRQLAARTGTGRRRGLGAHRGQAARLRGCHRTVPLPPDG
jgi:hypothetical protein